MKGPSTRRRILGGILAACALAGACEASTDDSKERASENSIVRENPGSEAQDPAESLPGAVRTRAIRRHLEQLQGIADDNGGNRAAGTSGYDASALYVGELLTEAGYRVTYQRFEFPAFIEVRPASLRTLSPDGRKFEPGVDFTPLYYSPSGRASGPVVSVDVEMNAAEPTSGCESSDFDGFPRGAVALLERSNCFFREQAGNAEEAGATGLIVFPGEKLPNDPLLVSTLTPTADVSIPVIGTTHSLGAYLAQAAKPRIDMRLRTLTEDRVTTNVVAESRWGDAGSVVMLGAHLDSVALGPGINDNGSGSAMILEIARQLQNVDLEKRVRFAFWGAEEVGLVGSFHYTDQLDAAEQEAIAAYLNFDMVGSPNYIRMIYEGRDSGSSDVAGSIAIQKVFEEYFRLRDLDVVVSDLVANRSDQTGFALAGIAVGGLFTGADDVKTESERIEFGGTAGARHDPCYHQSCDDLSNVDFEILGQMADAAAYATATLASDGSPLP